MTRPSDLLTQLVGWAFFLGVLFLSYRYVWKDSLPNFFYRGWESLQASYGVDALPDQPFITSARVGSDLYQGTMHVVLADEGVYLQRVLLKPYKKALFIPYRKLRLVAPPAAPSKKNAWGVYGIFEVDGVDIWLDKAYAEKVIAKLNQP